MDKTKVIELSNTLDKYKWYYSLKTRC